MMYVNFIVGLVLACGIVGSAIAVENKKAPLNIAQYPNTRSVDERFFDYESFYIATGAATGEKGKVSVPEIRSEGTIYSNVYKADVSISILKVFRSYQQALTNAGVEALFSCHSNEECGQYFVEKVFSGKGRTVYFERVSFSASAHSGGGFNYYYFSGKKSINDQLVYVELLVSQANSRNGPSSIIINTYIPQELELVPLQVEELSFESIEKDIQKSGTAILSGLYFDSDKTELKPESMQSLTVIAEYLKKSPQTSYFVVGHTDTDGSYDYNLTLSKGRADSVVKQLGNNYNINTKNLIPIGVGPVSPLASNADETLKNKNRRVELVLIPLTSS